MESVFLSEISALVQVVIVDLVLAGDNAIVVGLVAAGLPEQQRTRVIIAGIVAATVLRILFSLVTVQLLQIIGLMLAGGLLLLWVCWKLWREMHHQAQAPAGGEDAAGPAARGKTVSQAVWQIVLADVSMSLDNVLAVAGVAREHLWVLVFGLALSVAFMGAAATVIAKLLDQHRWIAYVGLAVIFYVACAMIWEGGLELVEVAQT